MSICCATEYLSQPGFAISIQLNYVTICTSHVVTEEQYQQFDSGVFIFIHDRISDSLL